MQFQLRREALCTVDIGNAVAYFLQVVTFIQFSIVNCEAGAQRLGFMLVNL